MPRKQKRVLLALGWYDYRLHKGIEKYAQEHGWHLYADYTREKVIPWGWEGDGILAWLGAGDDLAEFVSAAKLPTVDFSYRRPQLKFPRVLEDHSHAARLAADHFLTRGFTNFCYYSDAPNWSYEERGHGFIKALSERGYNCAWLRWLESPSYASGKQEWQRKRKWLAAQMKQAAKPLAVFGANDQQALDVLESCESVGIKIPEEVAILGTESYLLAPDVMHTPLSSVDTNLEVLGYRGAELLDHLMAGEKPPAEPVRVPAAGVIVRKSSDILTIKHQGVARSLRYIWEHGHEPICIKDLVSVSAMSRRGMHKAFMEHVGRTPGQELQRVRIEHAKRLLSRTSQKVESIAHDSGYQSINSFCVAFKRATGMSAKQFRDRMSRQSAA